MFYMIVTFLFLSDPARETFLFFKDYLHLGTRPKGEGESLLNTPSLKWWYDYSKGVPAAAVYRGTRSTK